VWQGRWSLPLLVVVLSALHIDSTLLAQTEQVSAPPTEHNTQNALTNAT
jgi:hypothetical protein